MAGNREDRFDQRLAKALGHPLRVQLLVAFGEETASPSELAERLGRPLSSVAYHTRTLHSYECLELVETRPVRGSTEHFYRAKPDAFIAGRKWRGVPPALRNGVAAESLQAFVDRAIAAIEAGTFVEGEGSGLNWSTMRVDEIGWQELQQLLDKALEAMKVVGDRSARRLGSSHGTPVVSGIVGFRARPGSGGAPGRDPEGS